MRNVFNLLLYPLCVCACTAAVLGAHALKWPESGDRLTALRQKTRLLAQSLCIDSPVALRAVGLPEDYFNHLRYAMIPRPLEMKMPRANRVVLLTADSTANKAVERLMYERPNLVLAERQTGRGFQLLLYKSGS